VGELRIVASGTRRAAAAHLHPYAAGNIVDVPALQWLARQPAPRLWISDGRVTGVGDRRDRAIDERVRAICRAGRIERVPDVGQAIGLLTGRGGRPATEAAEAGR